MELNVNVRGLLTVKVEPIVIVIRSDTALQEKVAELDAPTKAVQSALDNVTTPTQIP